MSKFSEQIRRHSVALISLAVAVSSLGYNTWRNEQSEANRNIRTAGIELLIKLGELDRIILLAQYGPSGADQSSAELVMHTRSGWAYVLTARDLGTLATESVEASTAILFETWSDNEKRLGSDDDESFTAISMSIDNVRDSVLIVLAELD